MGDALTRYRVDYKGGFATSDLTGFSSGVSVNFVTGDAYQRSVIGQALHSAALQDWPGKKNRPRKAGGEMV